MSAQVLALRELLHQRFPDAAPLTERSTALPVATGLPVLDRAFPGGGLPRARLTAWLSQGGALALLRSACQATVAAGERAAWVDAGGMVTASGGASGGVLLVRPEGRLNAMRSAEVVLRSGAFALVVLAGAEPEGREMVRLTRAAREGGAAFVALTSGAAMAAVRVTSRIRPHSWRWVQGPFADPALPREAAVEVRVRALGWNEKASVVLPVAGYELRLSVDAGLADRRGADRRGTNR